MNDVYQLRELTRKDSRYKIEAYYFVLETLDFARTQLQMGRPEVSQRVEAAEEDEPDEPESPSSHVTGQELCEALRIRATWMFGYMAKTVLNCWGVFTTDDIGEIVFNMVVSQKIRVTAEDSPEDFKNVYDFQKVFCDEFSIAEGSLFPETL